MTTAVEAFDLAATPLRALNQHLHDLAGTSGSRVIVTNPSGAHAVACGIDAEIEVEIDGHVGYYCAGMNKLATVRVHGNAGSGLPENMMSGRVGVGGSVSPYCGAPATASFCGLRHLAQGRRDRGARVGRRQLDVHGAGRRTRRVRRRGRALGDSLCEARIYLRGAVASRGGDCIEKEMRDEHVAQIRELLERAEIDDVEPADFRRYGSARQLYTFKIYNAGVY